MRLVWWLYDVLFAAHDAAERRQFHDKLYSA